MFCILFNSLSLLVVAALDDEITMTEDTIEGMMIVTITADHTGEAIFVILNYFLNCAFSSTTLPVEVLKSSSHTGMPKSFCSHLVRFHYMKSLPK